MSARVQAFEVCWLSRDRDGNPLFLTIQLISRRLPKADSALLRSSPFTNFSVSSLLRLVNVGETAPLPILQIQVVRGTVPPKCVGSALPAPSGVLSRSAPGELRCHPPPTSSMRVPEVTPN